MIRFLLTTASPTAIFWGPQRTYLYNDAMAPTLGSRRDWAQAAPGAKVWAEIWDTIAPQLDTVSASAGQRFDDHYLRIGHGVEARDSWWSYTQTAIEDDSSLTGIGGILVLASEVTAQRELDHRLGDERRRLISLFETSSSFVAALSGPDHVFELANPAYLALVGRDNLVGRPVREAISEAVPQGFIEVLDGVFRTGEPFIARNHPVMLNRGGDESEVRWLDFAYRRLDDAAGGAMGIIAEGFDVTDHARALQEARDANAVISALLEYSPDLILATGADGVCQIVSASSQDVLGYSPDEMVGRRYSDFLGPERSEVAALFDKMIAGTPLRSYENRVRRKDGTAATIRWSAVWSVERQLMVAVGRDVSDRVAAEERLRQAEKFDAIGKLTGGVAHDFNNLLTIILGNLDLVYDALAHRPDLQAMADLARTAAGRGAELTSHLLSYARQQPQEPVFVVGAEALTSLEPLIRRAVGELVSIEIRIADPDVGFFTDRAQLETALLNLAINARDAMPEGGSLILASGLAHSPVLANGRVLEGAFVRIEVRDTGQGMEASTLARAGEPFFTTKPVGRGTGLGLSMVSGFAEQSGGALLLQSSPGEGTRATIYLPLRHGTPASSPGPLAQQPTLAPARVLLVEDNKPLREQVQFLLIDAGCTVSAVGSAADALALLTSEGAFDLLFTDMVLPGALDGRQLAEAACLRDPGLKVLFTSGFTQGSFGLHSDLGAPLLRKPYRRHQLLEAVTATLADPAPSARASR